MTRSTKFFIVAYTFLLLMIVIGLIGDVKDDFKFPVDYAKGERK